MLRALGLIVLGVVLTVVGVAAGWYGAQRAATPQPDAHGGSREDGAEEEKPLSPQALKNLGIRIGKAKLATFVRSIEVQAVLVDRPENHRPVTTPLGGLVTAVHVETGRLVKAGDPIATIVRDPIPRPKAEMTSALLIPISEQVHEAMAALRVAIKRLDIADREIARVAPHAKNGDDFPVVSRAKLAELTYERERAQLAMGSARHELERHGLTDKEVDAVAAGKPSPPNPQLWQRVLNENGLWSPVADKIRAALPAADRDQPWTIAAIGELFAGGLATEAFATLLATSPATARRFAEAAGLLMQGMPLETVSELAQRGALEPRLIVRAPEDGEANWDVEQVMVRIGKRIEPGADVAMLYNPRRLWLQVEPIGREVGPVAAAVRDRLVGRARPLVPDPTLAGMAKTPILLRRLRAKEDGSGAIAFAELDNTPLCDVGVDGCRSWTLRAGTRFLLRLPAETFAKRFILPPGAITEEGPETIVYVQDGSAFRAVNVHIEYRDDERVVVANDGSLYPDDPLVIDGAYALGLALQKRGGGDGGHGHAHD